MPETNRNSDPLHVQFYYGGYPLLYRQTGQGREILAIGVEQILQFLRDQPPLDRQVKTVLPFPESPARKLAG